MKKLKLNKETIATLNNNQMEEIQGGLFKSRWLCGKKTSKTYECSSERTCFCHSTAPSDEAPGEVNEQGPM
ncbi:class I lanthipeptide [bacterium SCSIO 12741]|nr:class I lanthipeptide [bacterium SCSIO 12741]